MLSGRTEAVQAGDSPLKDTNRTGKAYVYWKQQEPNYLVSQGSDEAAIQFYDWPEIKPQNPQYNVGEQR